MIICTSDRFFIVRSLLRLRMPYQSYDQHQRIWSHKKKLLAFFGQVRDYAQSTVFLTGGRHTGLENTSIPRHVKAKGKKKKKHDKRFHHWGTFQQVKWINRLGLQYAWRILQHLYTYLNWISASWHVPSFWAHYWVQWGSIYNINLNDLTSFLLVWLSSSK
jgi:hypothetical protein